MTKAELRAAADLLRRDPHRVEAGELTAPTRGESLVREGECRVGSGRAGRLASQLLAATRPLLQLCANFVRNDDLGLLVAASA